MTADDTQTETIPETPPAETEPPKTETVSPAQIKSMEAALRKANKEAETHRLKLKELEDRDKSEADKAADRAAEAERRAQRAETALLRTRIALSKGLPAELADRLQGDTEAEMADDAEALLALVGKRSATTTAVPTGPRGSTGPADMNALLRRAAGRE